MMPMLAEIDWNSLLHNTDMLPLLLVIGSTTAVLLTAIIAVQWRKAQQASYEAVLKQQMIGRGFTAEDIKVIIDAGAANKRIGKVVKIRRTVPQDSCCPVPSHA